MTKTIEERIASLEANVADHEKGFGSVFQSLKNVSDRVVETNRRIDTLEGITESMQSPELRPHPAVDGHAAWRWSEAVRLSELVWSRLSRQGIISERQGDLIAPADLAEHQPRP